MTFAKRFDIKKAMQATTESIVEDLTGNDTPAGIDPESTNDLETPTAKVEVAQEGDTVDMLEASTPIPVEDDELAKMYEEEIEVGTEAIDLLGKLTTAIETSSIAELGSGTINNFTKVVLESICLSIKMPTDSKAYPSLESITVDTVKDFAAKLTTSVESFKEKVTELKAPKE